MSSLFTQSSENWRRIRLRFCIEGSNNGAWGGEPRSGEKDVICVRVADFVWDKLSLDLRNHTIRSISNDQYRKLALRKGDLLIEKSGGGEKTPVGRVVRFDEDVEAITSNFVARLRPSRQIQPNFLSYLLAALYLSGYSHQFVKQNIGIQNLDDAALFATSVNIPDIPTQKRIADFLDRETSRIDQLIKKKQRLVELLGERRQSLIEDTIGAEGPMTKLGHHIKILPGYAFASSEFSDDPEDIRLLRGANVSTGRVRWDDVVYWPRELASTIERFALKSGDVVLGMDRPWISSGIRVAELSNEDEPCLLLQRICKIEPMQSLDKKFMKLLLSSKGFLAYFEPILTGVSVPHISGDQIAGFRFSYIPVELQRERAKRCHLRLSQNEKLEAQVETSIDRLREFRSALITTAVTGQIDVKRWGRRGDTDRRMDAIEEETRA